MASGASRHSLSDLPPELLEINEGPRLLQILTPMAVVVTLVVFLRIGTRLSRRISIGLDDWLIVIALILSWGTYAIAILFVSLGGLGRPLTVNMAIDPNRLVAGLKLLFAGEIIYATIITVTKYSILAMYYRLFPTRFMKIGGWVCLGGMTTAWWLAIILVVIFQCKPLAKTFDPFMADGHCIDNTKFFLGNSIPNILNDVMILCLPMYEIGNLRLPHGQRVALVAVFMLGAGVVAMSAIRLSYHVKLSKEREDADFTLAMFNSVLWTILEPDMAVICASLPTLRPLLTTLLKTRFCGLICSYIPTTSKSSNNDRLSYRGPGYTIGGTPMRLGSGGPSTGQQKMGICQISTATSGSGSRSLSIENARPNEDSGYDIEIWPAGFANEDQKETRHLGCDEIPLQGVVMKTEADWQERRS
ncbi:hypothetical protein B0H66DRAFT_520947 [Apodospora peruviana]|uniref:Rhodopsin domain-containing protein n=1 Tax=Apodospora peruviana TaxID=516989 RepID=A0AAE0HXS9_9PEZI|nr:hypothetical protein B0H66DRAFT_520947 [Apodospora peruviana]